MSIDEIVFFKDDDPEIAKASKNAQESFRWYWYQIATDFNRIIPANGLSLIKAAFSDDFSNPDAPVEHMFVDSIYFDGETITGQLQSEPNWIKSVAEGEEVSLTLDRVGDWICFFDETVYGAFAAQVVRSRLSANDRQAHDEAWGIPFPEIGVNHIPTRSSEFEEMIGTHLQNAIDEDSQIVATVDDNLRTPLHYEVLYGRLATTKILLQHGADPNAKCDRGWTAADYANAVGWSELVELLQ